MKQYTVDFSGASITGTREAIEAVASRLGEDLHYSATTDTFVSVKDMHICHLKNAILLEFNDRTFSSVEEIEYMFEDTLFSEWKRRQIEDPGLDGYDSNKDEEECD